MNHYTSSFVKRVDVNHEIVRDAADEAYFQTGMLFVNGYGNTDVPGNPSRSSDYGFAVATAVNDHGCNVSHHGYEVTICGNGGNGGGTSFSTPAVAAVIALVKSFYPSMTGAQIRDKLIVSVNSMRDSLWNPIKSQSQWGYGLLDAYQAIAGRFDHDIENDTVVNGPIYIPKDIIVHTGDTLRINLASGEGSRHRTHVRFATCNFQNPYAVQRTKIIVDGILIVEGESTEKILFGKLRNDEQIGDWKWTGKWGGIVIRSGGKAYINNAVIENCVQPITVEAGGYLSLKNSELCHYDSCAIYHASTNLLVENCDIHDGGYGIFAIGPDIHAGISNTAVHDVKASGIELYTGVQTGYLSCIGNRVQRAKWGVVINGNVFAEIRNCELSDNLRTGLICLNNAFPKAVGNTIDRNGWHGVYINGSFIAELDSFYNNAITRNGCADSLGSSYSGLCIENGALYSILSNRFLKNPVGIRLERGIASARFYAGGLNLLDSNFISFRLDDVSKTELGLVYQPDSWGGYNSSILRTQTGYGLYHVLNENYSLALLQCDRWDPVGSQYYSTPDNNIVKVPDSASCEYMPWYVIKPHIVSAIAYSYSHEYNSAFSIYEQIANDTTNTEEDLCLSMRGLVEIYCLDSNRVGGQVEQLLDDISAMHANSGENVRGEIAYNQAVIAMYDGNGIAADSLLRFAQAKLVDPEQKRNALTMLIDVDLYLLNRVQDADSILAFMQSAFSGDIMLSSATNLRDLYRVDGILPAPKRSPQRDISADSGESDAISMEAPFPNPANERSSIAVHSGKAGYMRLGIYDSFGREVVSVNSGTIHAGIHHFPVRVPGLKSGVYFCILRMHGKTVTKKLCITR